MRRSSILLLALVTSLQLGCGGGVGNTPAPPQAAVSIAPTTASVRASETQQFTATVTGTLNTAVNWSVNGVPGGNATLGTISSSGLYTAPATLPNPSNVTVQATSVAVSTASASAAVSLLNPVPVLTAVNPTVAGVGAFTLNVSGSKFVNGAQIQFGGTALTTTFVSSTQLSASVTATAAQVGTVPIRVSNPDPGAASSSSVDLRVVSGNVVSAAAAVRFLEQATFGPTPDLIAQVQQVGFTNFLSDQFNAPMSTYPDPVPTDTAAGPLQQRFFTNALTGPDQLRLRIAFALHKIWVVSWVTVNSPQAFAPYLRMFQQDAFTNYRTIMGNVTLNPAMGQYQDIANNDKPDPARGISANENYGRELLQLFTIGVWQLNIDGNLNLDAQGNPIAAYEPVETVQGFARALTGWTYPTQPGRTPRWPNPPYFVGQLEAIESHHDTDPGKALLNGFILPAGQTARKDLDDALDNIFNHPNVPPHVSKLLIQQLVTSNPSPAYVQRVAQAFITGTSNGFGSGQRGDMKAAIAAILLDPEARRGDDSATAGPNDGKLREPVLLMVGLLRAFGASSDGAALISQGASMGQRILFPPTVFSYFSPEYRIPGSGLLGPEFEIQTTATSLVRANFVNSFVFGSLGGGTTVSFTPYATLAANPAQLLDALGLLLLHGTMSAQMRTSILNAVNAVSVSNPPTATQLMQRARTAIYLIATSSQHHVQR